MKRNRWTRPTETLDDGTPCFIAADQPEGKRPDYIWMSASLFSGLPTGYYHLTTQEAYIQVYRRLRQARLCRLCARSNKNQISRDMWQNLHNLMRNRLDADIPDDIRAQQLNVLHHQLIQNLQPLRV